MSHMTSEIRKMLDEYIDSISERDLERFVRYPITNTGYAGNTFNLGSDDFMLVFGGDSDDAPTEVLFMVELRANPASKHPALRALALNSTKVPQNQKRFAFLMYSPRVMEWMSAHHVRTALKAGPVWGEGVINKVLVDYDPRVEFVKTPYRQAPMPFPAPGMLPSQMFTYTPVAFKGFNVDGTKVPKHEKEKKKDAGKKK